MTDLAPLPALAAATFRPALSSLTLNRAALLRPDLLTRTPASTELTAVRTGLARVAVAEAAGLTTSARADTDLKLGEGEVMDVAQDYADPHLGEGLARLDAALGADWPAAKDAVWLGESGRAISLDLAFRKVPQESLQDFATLLKAATDKQATDEIDSTLAKMA